MDKEKGRADTGSYAHGHFAKSENLQKNGKQKQTPSPPSALQEPNNLASSSLLKTVVICQKVMVGDMLEKIEGNKELVIFSFVSVKFEVSKIAPIFTGGPEGFQCRHPRPSRLAPPSQLLEGLLEVHLVLSDSALFVFSVTFCLFNTVFPSERESLTFFSLSL